MKHHSAEPNEHNGSVQPFEYMLENEPSAPLLPSNENLDMPRQTNNEAERKNRPRWPGHRNLGIKMA